MAFFSRLSLACVLFVCVVAPVLAYETNGDSKKLLPDRVGDFRALNVARNLSEFVATGNNTYEIEAAVSRAYSSAKGENFEITLFRTRTDRGAYSIFSQRVQNFSPDATKTDGVGTSTYAAPNGILVFKGTTFFGIIDNSVSKNAEKLMSLAKLLAEPLDKGEGEIPVLVKHLPDWEANQQRAVYAVSLYALQEAAGHRPVLDAVSFSGGAEAVTALYGASRLVIVELTTPQLATESDARINSRINELRAGGQSIPSAYRRVGNYVVFVFDAPDEAVAAQLIDKIAYEQVVQWLGNNPNWLIRAEREYRRTTAGVIVAVFKASGLSLLICLGIGGIVGSMVFRRRRAQQATANAYSDAGGMLRLNIDEMTPELDPARLISKGDD